MSYKRKKLVLTHANRVKYERIEDFDESIFSEVYRNASRMVRRIVRENETYMSRIPDQDYSTDEQLNNVIPFLGGRGMGKSSAMFSYALFLKKSHGIETEYYRVRTENTRPHFCVMPRIDAAMMIKGENIMDIVLAKMWDAFDNQGEYQKKDEFFAKELTEKFKKVKKTYEIYSQTINGKETARNMTSVREMHELAACLNLREEFKKLVEEYLADKLPCCRREERFLVLSIDDLDMTTGGVYHILEQIRLFLIIPRVIVLVTADIDRLSLSCNKQLSEELLCRGSNKLDESRQIRGYVTNYLEKLFPGNLRIYMPILGTMLGVDYEIEMKQEVIEKLYNKNERVEEKFDERKLLMVLMAKCSNILFPVYRMEGHFLQKDSLRKIVNNLNALLNILDEPKEEWGTLIKDWYYGELLEYSKKLELYENGEELKGLLKENGIYLNEAIMNVVNTILEDDEKLYLQNDYGDVLKALDRIKGKKEIYNFISLLYSVQLVWMQRSENRDKAMEDFYKYRIFHPLLEGKTNIRFSGMERRQPIGSLFNMQLKDNGSSRRSIVSIFRKNQNEIAEIFRKANLCDLNFWNEEEHSYLSWGVEEKAELGITREIDQMNPEGATEMTTRVLSMVLYNKMPLLTISIDNLFYHALHYEENLHGYCRNLYQAVSEYLGKVESDEQIERHVSEMENFPVWQIENYRKWKEKYDIRNIADLLPVQSVELMHLIAETFLNYKEVEREMLWISFSGATISHLNIQLGVMIDLLRQIEKLYSYDKLGYQKYSDKISEYLDIIRITDMSDRNKRSLDVTVDEDFQARPVV